MTKQVQQSQILDLNTKSTQSRFTLSQQVTTMKRHHQWSPNKSSWQQARRRLFPTTMTRNFYEELKKMQNVLQRSSNSTTVTKERDNLD